MIINKKYEDEIIKCLPITWKGLKVYPIKISQIKELRECQHIITIKQQDLPMKFATLSYLRMIFLADEEGLMFNANDMKNWFYLACLLNMSLGFNYLRDEKFIEKITKVILNVGASETDLYALEVLQDGNRVRITDFDFIELREIIAEQNLIELTDESHNMELINAKNQLAKMNSNDNILYDFETELYSMSYAFGVDMDIMFDWSVRKYYKKQEAANRSIRHNQMATGEMSGITFKEGNPYPSWLYDKKETQSHMIPESVLNERKNKLN